MHIELSAHVPAQPATGCCWPIPEVLVLVAHQRIMPSPAYRSQRTRCGSARGHRCADLGRVPGRAGATRSHSTPKIGHRHARHMTNVLVGAPPLLQVLLLMRLAVVADPLRSAPEFPEPISGENARAATQPSDDFLTEYVVPAEEVYQPRGAHHDCEPNGYGHHHSQPSRHARTIASSGYLGPHSIRRSKPRLLCRWPPPMSAQAVPAGCASGNSNARESCGPPAVG